MPTGKVPAPPARAPVVGLIRRRKEPVVVQTLRSTVAAVLAYLAGLWLSDNPQPLLAPLTAVLVVQVTLYATLTTGIRRIASVVAGVLIAVVFADVVGLTWWSLGLLVLACLTVGQLLHLAPWVEEVAITGMLVLGVGGEPTQAVGRVVETLIGAAAGVLLNVLVAPPVYVQPAGEAIRDLAERLRVLLLRIADGLPQGASAAQAAEWVEEARRLDQQTAGVDAALATAEESLRLNPRGRQALGARLVLRSGLDTLEHCVVGVRSFCRSLTELAELHGADRPVYSEELAAGLRQLLCHLADAAECFGRLVLATVAATAAPRVGPDTTPVKTELVRALEGARAERDRIAAQLLSESEREPNAWELYGALLAHAERLMNELDVERRIRLPAEGGRREARIREVWRAQAAGTAGVLMRRLGTSVRTADDLVRRRLRRRSGTAEGGGQPANG
ncbi:aromatic acid exporter family protein [Streptomyces sp. NPDC048415]|uniref:FUSC family protein n=1 Tax=Streptomyces sp. NPDC048415 TaxID=3154822 RepID=UPI00341C6955